MATGQWPTIIDAASRTDPNGDIPVIAEMMSQHNDYSGDMPYKEANEMTGHTFVFRSSIPTGSFRMYNQGTPYGKSTTAKARVGMAMLRGYSQIDRWGEYSDFDCSSAIIYAFQQAGLGEAVLVGRDELLKPGQIDDLTEYVVHLSNRPADAGAIARAKPIFDTQCVACHGAEGKGDQAVGAPNLTDSEWLYGADRAAIRGQIFAGNGGVMPTWGGRLSPETIKALAVYIHSNAGGQ